VQISERIVDGVTVLDLAAPKEGEFSRELFLPQVDDILSAGAKHIVVNLEGLRWLNSTAIGLLMGAFRAADREGVTMLFAGANSRITEIMRITGMLSVWQAYPDVDTALAAIRGELENAGGE